MAFFIFFLFFGAVLVSVRLRGMTGCRGPVVASLWQKWGFHARLGANAVLLIWLASKGLEGTRSPPAPPLSPLWLTPAPPALLGSFPSCLGPPCTSKRNNAAASPCRPHPPCIQPLLTPCHPLFTLLSLFSNTLNMWIIILEQFHDQNTPPPLSPYSSYFHSSGMWIADPSLSLSLFKIKSTHSKNRTKGARPSLFGVWVLCVLTALFEASAPDTGGRKCMWQLDKCLACWPLGREALCVCVCVSVIQQ